MGVGGACSLGLSGACYVAEMPSNFWFSCLQIPSAGIIGMNHYTNPWMDYPLNVLLKYLVVVGGLDLGY